MRDPGTEQHAQDAPPPPAGVRMPWSALPEAVRAAVEAHLGAPVVEAVTQPGGFSPGVAARLRTADGRRAFVKAVGAALNPDSPGIYRAEARITAALPEDAPVPRVLWSYDDGTWVALLLKDVGAGSLPELDPWARSRLDRLAELEERWPEAVAGTTLLHTDLRADNLLLTPERVLVVDWPWACVGAAWVDLLSMLPSVAMQGGPDPDEILRIHLVSRETKWDAINTVLAAATGYFV